MSYGWENTESSPIEYFHGKLMDLFHEWREENHGGKTTAPIDGKELNDLIAKAKEETDKRDQKIVKSNEQEQSTIPVVNHRFHITLEDGETILNVQKLSKRNDINEKTKLYYELGHYEFGHYKSPWIRTGRFKKIKDPIEFRDTEYELDDPKFIAHHNFVFKNI